MKDKRKCTLCQEWKDAKEFDGKTVYYCKPCRKTYRSSERVRQVTRALHLRRTFNLTLEEFEALSNQQNGRCAICGEIPDKVLRVDHDHETDMIRGLLCDSCNVGLGKFKDKIELLESAIRYLKEKKYVGT